MSEGAAGYEAARWLMQGVLRYRHDIDGLRALAVLLVVLYHLQVPGLSGGFVGVDVFFVISGFVVTRVIAPSIAAGTFSFRRFYINRFWRLQPAFFLVCVASLAASYFVLAPEDLLRTAQSAAAAAFMSANVFFWKMTAGYSSPLAEQEPLLHAWSLAVEEQFYLLWPLLLVLALRWRFLRRPFVFGPLLAALVGLSELLAQRDPTLAYYLLPARLMELGLGALLVKTESFVLPRRFSLAASVLGFALIVAPALVFDENTTFPGLRGFVPCLGAALLIQAGSAPTPLQGLLDNRLARQLGKASYSFYLWHWPPIALANYLNVALTPPVQLLLGGGALALSLLTYRFWESPTRRHPPRAYRVATFGLAAAAAFCVAGVLRPGSVTHIAALQATETSNETDANIAGQSACLLRAKTWKEVDRCTGARNVRGRKRVLIWGDSHARELGKSILGASAELNVTPTTLWFPGCPPVFDVHREDKTELGKKCNEKLGRKVRRFIDRHRFDAIIVVGRFGVYERGWIRAGKLARATHFLSDEKTRGVDAKHSAVVLSRNLLRTVRHLAKNDQTRVVFVLPTPVLPRAPKTDKARTLHVPREAYLENRKLIVDVANKLPPSVHVLDPLDALCDRSACAAWDGDKALYKDDNHLTALGTRRLVPLVSEALRAQGDR